SCIRRASNRLRPLFSGAQMQFDLGWRNTEVKAAGAGNELRSIGGGSVVLFKVQRQFVQQVWRVLFRGILSNSGCGTSLVAFRSPHNGGFALIGGYQQAGAEQGNECQWNCL